MSDTAIRVENLSKQYHIGGPRARYKTLRESLTEAVQTPFRRLRAVVRGQSSVVSDETIWALKAISFEVKRGEVVGIIGRNGAGKTTLLKILSRITEPTEGRARLRGRVGSLLEVGTGFHPELTGRENIYLNGAILGMKRAEIEHKFDEIVAFAEVEKFMDTPVKHYSSGMYVRLAFAVAAHLEPEILLVDEVLAVGDAAFQKKCLGKMGTVAKEGRTVLFVSHNMIAISNLCNRTIWLESGKITENSETATVISSYLNSLQNKSVAGLAQRTDRTGNGRLWFEKVWLTNNIGEPISSAVSGSEVTFKLQYAVQPDDVLHNVRVSINIRDLYEQVLFEFASFFTGQDFDRLSGTGVLTCQVPSIPLVADTYTANLWSSVNGVPSDVIRNAFQFTVDESDFYGAGMYPVKRKHGTFLVPHSWGQE